MAHTPDPTRRRLLQGSAVLAPAAALLAADMAGAQVATPGRDDLGTGAPQEGHVTHPGYRPAFFSAAEWAFVCAAVDRLIPRDEHGPGALELGVAEYIDRQMQTPWAEGARWYMHGPFVKAEPEFGYQSKLTPREQHRLGVRAVDDDCRKTHGKPFADLAVADRDAVLKAMESGDVKSGDFNLKTATMGASDAPAPSAARDGFCGVAAIDASGVVWFSQNAKRRAPGSSPQTASQRATAAGVLRPLRTRSRGSGRRAAPRAARWRGAPPPRPWRLLDESRHPPLAHPTIG